MARPKGGPRLGGREKGASNKSTRGVKDNILDVFERIGGVKNFAEWAMENQTEFYRHYAKILPLQVNVGGQLDNPITVVKRIIVQSENREMIELAIEKEKLIGEIRNEKIIN
jgi:hypothetical protein